MKKKPVLLFVFLVFAAALFAGPPYTTDDPQPIPYRHWEVYLFSSLLHNNFGSSGILPGLEVNYGVFSDLQAHIILPVNFSSDNSKKWAYGYGNTEIGLKYRFVQETDIMPQIGTFPHYEISTGSLGGNILNGQPQAFLPLWLQKSWGQFTSYGGGGYWFNTNKGSLNWLFLGWVLQYAFLPNVNAGLEINYNTPTDQGLDSNNSANIGVQIDLDSMNHILASIGQSMTGNVIYLGYIAYQMTFGPDAGK